MSELTVKVGYETGEFDAAFDQRIYEAAGRASDFAGMDMAIGFRDHGWACGSEIEAQRIVKSLKSRLGLTAIVLKPGENLFAALPEIAIPDEAHGE